MPKERFFRFEGSRGRRRPRARPLYYMVVAHRLWLVFLLVPPADTKDMKDKRDFKDMKDMNIQREKE